EHAPWALLQYGFRAVISTSFADIFRGNSLKNSLLPIVVPRNVHAELFKNPNITVKVDLAAQTLTLPDGKTVEFPVDGFSKHCLLEGIDELGYILHQEPAIASFEAAHPAPINTTAEPSPLGTGPSTADSEPRPRGSGHSYILRHPLDSASRMISNP